MDPKTLSEIMGHYSVSFTLDTYAHVLDGHKKEAVSLLGDLFIAQPQSAVYPLVVTTEDDGLLLFDLIDFPDIDAEASNMAEGIASIKEQAQEAILTLRSRRSLHLSSIFSWPQISLSCKSTYNKQPLLQKSCSRGA